MTDIVLKTIASGYNLNKINDNFEKVEAVINDEIVHTTGGNNTMSQELDMNSNRILNLPTPVSGSEPVRLSDVEALASQTTGGSTISETPPIINTPGDRWTRCSDMKAFLWYVDVDGGQWIEDRPSYGIDTIQNLTLPYEFDTVAAMVTSTIVFPIKKVLATKGFDSIGDSGAAEYIVTTGASPDTISSPNVAGGNYAKVQNVSNLLQVGGSLCLFEGDSITEGNTIGGVKYSDEFATLPWALANTKVPVLNTAIGGSEIPTGANAGNNITDRYAAQVFPHRPTANGGDGGIESFLFLLIGTNDIDNGGLTGAQVITALSTYTTAAINDGFTVVLQTILPRKGAWLADNETQRVIVNRAIIDGTIPSSIISDTAKVLRDPLNFQLFHDNIHPTVRGSDMIAFHLNAGMLYDFDVNDIYGMSSVAVNGELSGLAPTSRLRFGGAFMSTLIGETNNNGNGFLGFKNLVHTVADEKHWQWQCGLDGANIAFQARNDINSATTDVMKFTRVGMAVTETEFLGALKTTSPSVTGQGAWNLGKEVTGQTGLTVDATSYLEVKIDGVVRRIALLT